MEDPSFVTEKQAASRWSRRRKSRIATVIATIITVLAAVYLVPKFYTPPNCSDGVRNGGETGVDCGGECALLCAAEYTPLSVKATYVFPVSEGLYNGLAIIDNQNPDAWLSEHSFTYTAFDDAGNPVLQGEIDTPLLPGQETPLFIVPLRVEDVVIDSISVSAKPVRFWERSRRNPEIVAIEDRRSEDLESKPKVFANIRNLTDEPIFNSQYVIVVYDENAEPIAASRTFSSEIPARDFDSISFAWPEAFALEPQACTKPTDTMLVIDRSGSMNDDSKDPQQPMTDVLQAARTYVAELKANDRVGVVTFATDSDLATSAGITYDKNATNQALSAIRVRPEDETGYTNIGAGIKTAFETMFVTSEVERGEREAVIVVLTDGVANFPFDIGEEDQAQTLGENYALGQANQAKQRGISVYAIGLGAGVNASFLNRLSSGREFTYLAATTQQLSSIYEQIASATCAAAPSIIEITPIIPTAYNVQ